MIQEMPAMSTTTYTSSTTTGDNLWFKPASTAGVGMEFDDGALMQKMRRLGGAAVAQATQLVKEISYTMRIVKVFIADPNENIPLNQRLLYSGEEQVTDLTDQELFFEISIAELLKNHNTLRATVRDKKASERANRDVFLEPVRVRDLKMTVVEVAKF